MEVGKVSWAVFEEYADGTTRAQQWRMADAYATYEAAIAAIRDRAKHPRNREYRIVRMETVGAVHVVARDPAP